MEARVIKWTKMEVVEENGGWTEAYGSWRKCMEVDGKRGRR